MLPRMNGAARTPREKKVAVAGVIALLAAMVSVVVAMPARVIERLVRVKAAKVKTAVLAATLPAVTAVRVVLGVNPPPTAMPTRRRITGPRGDQRERTRPTEDQLPTPVPTSRTCKEMALLPRWMMMASPPLSAAVAVSRSINCSA